MASFTKGDHSDLLGMLETADPARVPSEDWPRLMAGAKASGIPYGAVDEFNRRDPARYDEAENRRRWDSFNREGGGTAGSGTVVRILEAAGGVKPTYGAAGAAKPATGAWPEVPADPCEQMALAVRALFRDGDLVNVVSDSGPNAKEPGKPRPRGAGMDRLAGELAGALEAHRGEGDAGLRAVIGDYSGDAGAWWRANPVLPAAERPSGKAKGVRDADIARCDHALIECDPKAEGGAALTEEQARRSRAEQIEGAKRLVAAGAPVVLVTDSGGKSIHVLVRVDAGNDLRLFRERFDALRAFCESIGMGGVDGQNRNPSRLSRLPGATRHGRAQRLLYANPGAPSWGEFEAGALAGRGEGPDLRALLVDGQGKQTCPATDLGLSQIFGEWSRDGLAYVPEFGSYLSYEAEKGVWEKIAGRELAERKVKGFIEGLYPASGAIADDGERGEFRRALSKYDRYNSRRNLLADAKECLLAPLAGFDADGDLLNVENGTLDLRTMALRGHRASDRLTMLAPVRYDPAARCGAWEAFMADAQRGDGDTIRYIQKLFGLCLIAGNPEQKFWLFHGATRSGKSTALEVLGRLLGPGYSRCVQPETFAEKERKDSGRPSSDLARMAGARFVRTSETPEGMLFGAARLKQLTGGDTVTARFLNQNEFEFVPEFVSIMATNHLPCAADRTLFESGRLVAVPWMNHKGEEEQDKGLGDRLTAPGELSGLLNWCLAGLEAYRAEGLKPSTAIDKATEEYRMVSDKTALFISECMEQDPNGRVAASEVYERYREWCAESNSRPLGKLKFFGALRDRGMITEAARVGGASVRNVCVSWRFKVGV